MIVNLYACSIAPKKEAVRTLTIGDNKLQESKPGEFTSWRCSDYYDGGKTLVEVGEIPSDYLKRMSGDSKEMNVFIKMVGFVLYDGSNAGDITLYQRRGINHRWDWNLDGGSYSFIIEPDGKGLFYDFSTAKDGEKVKADNIYICRR